MKHERETLDAVIKARNASVANLDAAKGDPANAELIRQLGEIRRPTGCGLGAAVRIVGGVSPI